MGPHDLSLSPGYVIPPIMGFLVLTGLAMISLVRGGMRRVNLLFAAISFLAALLNADMAIISILPDERLALRVDRAIHLLFVFSIPIYIMFVHEFLGIRHRRWMEITAFLISIAFLPIVPTDFYYSGVYYYSFGRIARAGVLFPLFSVTIAFMVVYCLVVLLRAMKRTDDNLKRNRIKYIFWGMGFSALLLAFTILPVSGIPVYPLGNFSFIPAMVLAYGVLKYDLLDIGTFIRRGTLYFLLTGILTTFYILVIFFSHHYFLMTGIDSVSLSLVLAMIIVIFFNPLKERLRNLIERLFFRGRYDYHQLLRDISGKMSTLHSFPEIRGLLVGSIGDALQVKTVRLIMIEGDIFRCYGEGTGDAEEMHFRELTEVQKFLINERRPLRRTTLDRLPRSVGDANAFAGVFKYLRGDLIIPLPSPNGIAGFIVLGQKRSGELFVEEDLELLTTIANQASTAIENARSYEALEALNRDLEQKVIKRTAALREALKEKEKTQEQLIRSESLAAIGQLVAGTAHELNNPISGAMSLVESSVETIEGWETTPVEKGEILEDLRFSIGELRRAAVIIRSLLDLSRQTQTYVEPVDMNRVVDDALRVLYNQYKNLPVEIDKDYGELPTVEGNFGNLGQVLINIIRNALQALPEGRGRITLITRYQLEKDEVEVICCDTGVGIPARFIKDIFKPFFTTKSVGQGTGLGLYISHEIIRRHGGQIRAVSEKGRGTVMTVELPCRRREV